MYKLILVSYMTLLAGTSGCAHHAGSITAVPLSLQNQGEPDGIPYYLPKPLLIIAKNTRRIDESKVGLTNPVPIPNGFDNQAAYGDIKANVTVPGSGELSKSTGAVEIGDISLAEDFDKSSPRLPSQVRESMTRPGQMNDGIAPDSFFTYQIIFVPDISQKYGLRVTGGPGEVRAAMNLVNGWMYTGMGPYYLKDGSTAQNTMAFGAGVLFSGRGAADVQDEAGNLAAVANPSAQSGSAERATGEPSNELADRMTRLARFAQSQAKVPETILNYAEIYIYEPFLNSDGSTEWRLIVSQSFDRHYFSPEVDDESLDLLKSILRAYASPDQGDKSPELEFQD